MWNRQRVAINQLGDLPGKNQKGREVTVKDLDPKLGRKGSEGVTNSGKN